MLFKNEQGEQVLTLEDMICHFEDGGAVISDSGKVLKYVGRKPYATMMSNLVFQEDDGVLHHVCDNLNIHGIGYIVGVAPEKKLTPAEILDLMKQGRIGKTRGGSKVKFGYISECDEVYPVRGDIIHASPESGRGATEWTIGLFIYDGPQEEECLDIVDVFPEGTEFK